MSKSVVKIIFVIVIILIFIYIIHTIRVKNVPNNGGKLKIRNTYVVKDTGKCFIIDGVEKKTLTLKRGETYEFKIEADEPFYFTTSSKGGQGGPESLAKNAPEGSPGLYNGVIYFKVTDELPSTFYYQSDKKNHYGGQIILE